jgi:hypothetical protein
LVTPKPYKDENNFVKIAARLADELRPQIIMVSSGLTSLIILQMLKVITKELDKKSGNKLKVK